MKGGKYLLVAHGNAEEVARAQDILQGSAATEVNRHAEESMDTTAIAAAPAHAH